MSGLGMHGKIPARGDFLSRGLPPAFVDPFHAWLARGLVAARERLGERFAPAYMQAPVWRFVLPPGACGPSAALGVLMPSVDSVGRAFPLALAVALDGVPRADACIAAAADWFDRLETQARAVLADDFALEPWLAALGVIPGPPQAGGRPFTAWQRVAGAGQTLAEAAGDCLRRAGADRLTGFWSAGSPYVGAGLLIGPGLPEGVDFVRLLAEEAGEEIER